MTAAPDTVQSAATNKPAAKRHTMGEVLRALSRPRVLYMLLLGFSCGIPFLLVGNTLSYWLRDKGLSLSAITALSWVGIAYFLKWLWAPFVDRLDVPLLGKLGRRRGWMLLAQIVVGLSLAAMAWRGPEGGLPAFVGLTLAAAFGAAFQDTVVDAWRIEAADTAEELGLMTAAYTLGYRFALICTDALILILAQYAGWNLSYGAMAAAMAVGVLATLLAFEPKQADEVMHAMTDEAPLWSLRGAVDAVVGPFVTFFRTYGMFAVVMLLTITLYHLSDYLRGPILNPFYHDAGYTKVQVGVLRVTLGLAATLAGVAAGGIASVRLGLFPTLIVGAVLQPIGIGAFAWVALAGAPNLPLFTAINCLDNFGLGIAGVALLTYMSSLTSLGYTASQYAVMSSAVAFAGKTLKGLSGFIIEGLQHGRDLMHAYALFYLGVAALGVPAIGLCFLLAAVAKRKAPA
jgi:PAT family beta-lactamase induction signal transducer AmpG